MKRHWLSYLLALSLNTQISCYFIYSLVIKKYHSKTIKNNWIFGHADHIFGAEYFILNWLLLVAYLMCTWSVWWSVGFDFTSFFFSIEQRSLQFLSKLFHCIIKETCLLCRWSFILQTTSLFNLSKTRNTWNRDLNSWERFQTKLFHNVNELHIIPMYMHRCTMF